MATEERRKLFPSNLWLSEDLSLGIQLDSPAAISGRYTWRDSKTGYPRGKVNAVRFFLAEKYQVLTQLL